MSLKGANAQYADAGVCVYMCVCICVCVYVCVCVWEREREWVGVGFSPPSLVGTFKWFDDSHTKEVDFKYGLRISNRFNQIIAENSREREMGGGGGINYQKDLSKM